MGRVRRLATPTLSVVALLLLMVAISSAVQAARAMDVEISGPGMRSPVLIRWADLVRGAPPDVSWFDPATEPTGDFVPVFAMRIFNFIPTNPPTHLDVDLWSYYPRVGLIQTGERERFYSRWIKPTASIRSVLDHAIAGATAGDSPGRGQGAFWGVLAMIIGLAVLVVLMARRAWHRSPMVASRVDDA
jgi:hypothetical protein